MNVKLIVSFVSKLSKRERAIFYVTVFVVGLILLDRLILSPILSKIDELDVTIETQEEAIKMSMLMVAQEDRIEGESKKYTAFLSKPQIKEEEILNPFKQEVENMAKKSSVYLIDIKSAGKNVSADKTSTRYFVKLNFEAQMEQVFHFFHSITNHKELLKVESYQINPKSEGSSVVTCSMSISKTIIPE